jgi:uncharacterized phage-associated protein
MEEGTVAELSYDFDREKAVEAIIFLSERIKEPTLHSLTHLLYFADKTSLERYGRLICGGTYAAMPHGTVHSQVLNLLKAGEDQTDLAFRLVDRFVVEAKRGPDLDSLAESDIQCLEEVAREYGDWPFWRIKRESEDRAYWEAWNSRGAKKANRMSFESIVSQLDNPEELLGHLQNRHSR